MVHPPGQEMVQHPGAEAEAAVFGNGNGHGNGKVGGEGVGGALTPSP